MKQTASLLYFLIGILFPILIGGLHTAVHFMELVQPEVRQLLSQPILIMGAEQSLWNTWGVMSYMMGTSFIIIGLLNIVVMRKYGWRNGPPVMGILVMLLYLSCVIYVGYTYQALPQFYGGLFGILLSLLCLVLAWRGKLQAQK
ncbi:MAG: hypothetical protein AAF242_15835 [Bacteroidota bacterium]